MQNYATKTLAPLCKGATEGSSVGHFTWHYSYLAVVPTQNQNRALKNIFPSHMSKCKGETNSSQVISIFQNHFYTQPLTVYGSSRAGQIIPQQLERKKGFGGEHEGTHQRCRLHG